MTQPIEKKGIDRRCFNAWMACAVAAGLYPGLIRCEDLVEQKVRVAALQMVPKLGNVQANLEQAEQLIVQACRQGASWIVLPEMFTTAVAFHPDILISIQELDGVPAQMMSRLARKSGCVIGGSFLAKRNGDVYNSFLLVFPNGDMLRHDKDFPTYWENCFYRGGEDDGVLNTPVGKVGSILCWEFIRSKTMHRLKGKVRMVLGGSCWWTLSDEVDADSPLRSVNFNMLKSAPADCARMLGVPVVHGSHAGRFNAFFSPDLPDIPYDSSYLGEAMIVDASGQVLVKRSADEGAGIAMADITLPTQPAPTLPIPDRFWIPREMPVPWKTSWKRWLGTGSHYYETVTRPYLSTGVINEYIPEYML